MQQSSHSVIKNDFLPFSTQQSAIAVYDLIALQHHLTMDQGTSQAMPSHLTLNKAREDFNPCSKIEQPHLSGKGGIRQSFSKVDQIFPTTRLNITNTSKQKTLNQSNKDTNKSNGEFQRPINSRQGFILYKQGEYTNRRTDTGNTYINTITRNINGSVNNVTSNDKIISNNLINHNIASLQQISPYTTGQPHSGGRDDHYLLKNNNLQYKDQRLSITGNGEPIYHINQDPLKPVIATRFGQQKNVQPLQAIQNISQQSQYKEERCSDQSKIDTEIVPSFILTKPEYNTYQLNGQLKSKIQHICNNHIIAKSDKISHINQQNERQTQQIDLWSNGSNTQLIQIQFNLKQNIDLYIVHHLFNYSDFSKQDLLIPFDSQDMVNMRNTYGDDINTFKLEIVPSPQLLDCINSIEQQIYIEMKQTSAKQEVLNFQSIIQNNDNIQLFVSLDLILKYHTMINIKNNTNCQQQTFNPPLINILDVIRFIVQIMPKQLTITPEFVDIRQKQHYSIVQPRFWIIRIDDVI